VAIGDQLVDVGVDNITIQIHKLDISDSSETKTK